ncbi:Gfo/Idh/MocA family oxidoreductase [uncultured Draconibacterium sp.]|uniref:Gfo/Idh/MocA family protein n=1 Tax=uncultured Draconibacterium sp. TaxID=1573823 RepID=UPI002AA9406D|nr:Gfo/Idh/MocA family oxidoreductase [uncultured Draconibacterium sp.]
MNRRDFVRNSGMAATAFSIVPGTVFGKTFGHTAPSDKLNIAGVGIGGMGRNNLRNMSSENIVALCDVDWDYAAKTFNDYPNATKFKDWRAMFDKMGDSIDAVMVATPDHTHAGVTAHAITLGKHVYTQKPLTHSVYESRLLNALAKKYGVATQMGNQGNSFTDIRRVCEWIWSGAIGEVTEVHAWTDRPIWPQGLQRPAEKMSVPKTLDWDLFLGPAKYRPYHSAYTPWNWRGWWDFGTGALGDMACHVLDPVFWALNLKYPSKVEASSTLVNIDSPPHAEIVKYTFPARKNMPDVGMPEVEVTWYDGGLLPSRPIELSDGAILGKDSGGGLLFVGTKGKIMTSYYGMQPTLLPESKMADFVEPEPVLRRIPGSESGPWSGAHERDWIRACKEPADSRVQPGANFDYAGPFNEMVVMGVLAVRLHSLHRTLEWDGENMQFTNISDSDKIKVVTKDDFEVVDGDPRFNREFAEMNAKEMANEWINHTYRDGWELPKMP